MPKQKALETTTSTIAITAFITQYRFLSNFYPISTGMFFEGIVYPSSEHAYQAAKCISYEDKIVIAHIALASYAKAYGQKVALVPEWDKRKVAVMRAILTEKFSIPELAQKLLATGDVALVEGNQWHDNFWGDCLCTTCVAKTGNNILGKLLVQTRTDLYLRNLHDHT